MRHPHFVRPAFLALSILLGAAPTAQAQGPNPAATIYGIATDGSLKWYRHNAAATGGGLNDAGAWDPKGSKEVGVGWNGFKQVFAGGGGSIYGILPNGDLMWYRHDGYTTGGGLNDPGGWSANSRRKVGVGWNGFKQVFSGGQGVIYAITPDGSLKWYKHNAYLSGAGLESPSAWDPRSGKEIGVGWNSFTDLFAGRGGVIYGVLPDGSLRWYKHRAYLTGGGLNDAGAWDPRGGKEIGVGWKFKEVFGF